MSGPDGEQLPSLTHEQIGAGETLEVPVGATLRIYAKASDVTYGADLDGTSVVPTTGLHDDRVAHFRAARPGTTRMTVTVANKTERDEIGTVTVVVK